jgi:hypothetical protein
LRRITLEDPVPGRHLAQVRERHALALGRLELERPLAQDRIGHRLVDQIVERGQLQNAEHLLDLGLSRADVAAHEVAPHLEVFQRAAWFRHDRILLHTAGCPAGLIPNTNGP